SPTCHSPPFYLIRHYDVNRFTDRPIPIIQSEGDTRPAGGIPRTIRTRYPPSSRRRISWRSYIVRVGSGALCAAPGQGAAGEAGAPLDVIREADKRIEANQPGRVGDEVGDRVHIVE